MDDFTTTRLLPNGSVPIRGGAPDDDPPNDQPAPGPGVTAAQEHLREIGWLPSGDDDPEGGENQEGAEGEGDGEGDGEGEWTPPALIRPDRDWDGSFPDGPAEVYGEVAPYATWARDVGTAEGLANLSPEQTEAAFRGAIESARSTAQREEREQYNSQLASLTDQFLLELGGVYEAQGEDALRAWSQEKPQLYRGYLDALSRAGDDNQNDRQQGERRPGAAQVRASNEADAVFAMASDALRKLPEADRTRIEGRIRARQYVPTVQSGLKLLADIHAADRAHALAEARKARGSEAERERRERANQPARALAGAAVGGDAPSGNGRSGGRHPDDWLTPQEVNDAWMKQHFNIG